MATAVIGVIGGTGVYKIEGMTEVEQVEVTTPFGSPSDAITIGKLGGVKCAFLARHGVGHRITPTEVNYKANIFAMKKLGVKYLLSVSACGSLREDYKPLDLVLVDDFIDRTKNRDATFFGNGLVGHVMFGDPTCKQLGELVKEAVGKALPDVMLHPKGTYVCMEGPAFSTRAESKMYRQWGGDVIGMTALTEAKLAREAEMSWALVSLVTDYDCWRVEEDSVACHDVLAVLKKNGDNVQIFVKEVIKQLSDHLFDSPHHEALKFSLVTSPDLVPNAKKVELAPIIGKYMPAE